MKILVIDTGGQIAAALGTIEAELVCFSDEIQALNAAEQQPELIVLNYTIRGEQTPDYIRLLLAASLKSNLLVVGDKVHEDDVFRCLLSGAKGFQDLQRLAQYSEKLVRVVMQGEAWVTRKMVARLLDAIQQLKPV